LDSVTVDVGGFSITEEERRQFADLIQLSESGRCLISEVLHVVKFHGIDYASDITQGRPVLEGLLDSDLGIRLFGSPPMRMTREGVQYSSPFESGPSEFHTDQVLATFAQLEVVDSTSIRVGNRQVTVRDVVNEVVSRFYLRQKEIEWTAIAMAYYLDTPGPFKNHLGEEWCFDDLARELIDRDFRLTSCGGVHRLEAIVAVERAGRRKKVLSEAMQASLSQFISTKARLACLRQKSDGTWPADWYKTASAAHDGFTVNSKTSDLLVTSHLTQWLFELPDRFVETTQRDSAISLALPWLRHRLLAVTPGEIRSQFCPLTHAAQSVLRGR